MNQNSFAHTLGNKYGQRRGQKTATADTRLAIYVFPYLWFLTNIFTHKDYSRSPHYTSSHNTISLLHYFEIGPKKFRITLLKIVFLALHYVLQLYLHVIWCGCFRFSLASNLNLYIKYFYTTYLRQVEKHSLAFPTFPSLPLYISGECTREGISTS